MRAVFIWFAHILAADASVKSRGAPPGGSSCVDYERAGSLQVSRVCGFPRNKRGGAPVSFSHLFTLHAKGQAFASVGRAFVTLCRGQLQPFIGFDLRFERIQLESPDAGPMVPHSQIEL